MRRVVQIGKVVFSISLFILLQAEAIAQFVFTTNGDNTITITGYSGPGGNVVIPSATNGYPVTSIGNSIFYLRTNITGLTIPNGVTNIGYNACGFCSGLTNVTIPSSVINIGAYAFSGCSSLTSLTIATNVINIGAYGFASCSGLSNLTVDANNIGFDAFWSCSNLTSVAIGNSVINIYGSAFYDCWHMTNVTIDSGVTNLGSYVFMNCSNLHQALFLGNAPSVLSQSGALDNTMFSGESGIVYYAPGTTGWNTNSTFGGWPTTVYQSPPALGISTYSGGNPAVFFPTTKPGNYVVQMTTNLAGGTWITATSGVPISGIIITNAPSNVFFRFQLQ